MMILWLAACAGPHPADDSDAIEGAPDCTGEAFPVTCDGSAIDLQLDGTRVEVPLSWSYDAGCGASVAEVVQLRPAGQPLSLHVTVDAGSQSTYAEVALDGAPLVTLEDLGEPPHRQGYGAAGSVRWPDAAGQPLPDGACLAVRPILQTAASGGVPGRLLVAARGEPGSRIDVATYIVSGSTLAETELDGVIAAIADLYASTGLTVEEVHRGAVDWPSTEVGLGEDRATILASLEPPSGALPLVFTETLRSSSGSVIGVAGGIPGGLGPGTGASGVFTALLWARSDGALDADYVASTTAHEMGHHLGLFHTSESDGLLHDGYDDTPQCTRDADDADGDGTVEASECSEVEVANLMFWAAVGGQEGWSDLQIEAIQTSLHVLP